MFVWNLLFILFKNFIPFICSYNVHTQCTSKIIYELMTRKIFYRIDIQCIFYNDDNYTIIMREMISKITPVKVIYFTKISVALTCAWPPPPNATKFNITLFKSLWYMCYLSSILLLLPLINSVYEYRDDPVILAKSVCLSCAVLQIILKMTICRIRYKLFQVQNLMNVIGLIW